MKTGASKTKRDAAVRPGGLPHMPSVVARRARRAAVVVGACVCSAAAFAVWDWLHVPSVPAETLSADTWGWNGGSFLSFPALGLGRANAPPGSFEREGLETSDRTEVRFDDRSQTVGFSMDGSPDEAMRVCRSELEGKGWECVESGVSFAASFFKTGGEYRWMFVTCVPAGEMTSIVAQYRTAQEERG